MSLNAVNSKYYFENFPEDVIRKVMNYTGELSNVAQVCKLFRDCADKEGERIYKILKFKYGSRILPLVFAQLPYNAKSLPAKIDALYDWAKTQSVGPSSKRSRISHSYPNFYDAHHLKDVLNPYKQSFELYCLWEALKNEVADSFKLQMDSIHLDLDPLINLKQMREFLQSHLTELERVKKLILNKKDIRDLPKEILFFKNLTSLDLSENHLKKLPDLSSLKCLERLNLNGNKLAYLPTCIGDLSELSFLSAANNKISFLDESITQLLKLKALSLGGNSLVCLPETIGRLALLEELSLENNFLQELPESIGALKMLKFLYLGDNDLTFFPESIAQLTDLCILSAPQNRIAFLPENIDSLARLQVLVMDSNFLTKLPKSLKNMKHLSHVFASDNLLNTTPVLSASVIGLEGNPCTLSEVLSDFPVSSKGLKKREEFLKIYDGLDSEKWKECVEGIFHEHGRLVFDRGLHGGKKEPGYISSMESLFEFLKDNFGRRIDADFYLEMHEVACAHFDGEKTQTSDKSSIGKFRDQAVSAHFSEPHYTLTAKGAQEFNDLNFRLSRILGRTCLLGEFSKPKPNSSKLSYQKFSHEQIRILFNLFITEFYTEIDSAQSSDDYLRAIAKLVQCLEWLHPPLDGCGRVDTALLNFLLASYADLNPALLRCTYVSSCYGLDEWAQYLKDGMKEWKQACQEVNFRKKLKADRHQ